MKWSTNLGLGTTVPLLELDAPKENAYTFSYDTLNRLKSASFHTRLSTGWGASAAYHEKNLKYDLNGNILKLDRTEAEGATMDQLSYTYTGNQLQKVADASGNVKGFSDGPNPDNDYAYDANGNMMLDRNKDITAITYNHLNLPEKVTKNTGEYIKYTYDATGRKLSQGVYKGDNTLQKKTDYTGEFFYENDTLKFINHEEGRVVMTGATPEYQYHLKDHLGNVRMTFTSKAEETSATATLEEANAVDEQGEFIYYNEAVKVYSRLFDHTNNATNGDGYAIRLTGATTDKTYGLVKSLSVMPGDTVKMEVFAKYITGTPANNSWTGDLPGTMLAIASNTPTVMVDGGLAGSIGNQVFPFIGFIERGDEESTPPKAYLNWLVFNRMDSLVDFGYISVTTNALENGSNGNHEHLLKDNLLIREPGYVYIYLSNENEDPVEVFFDDFKIEHVKSPVVAVDDYYPFGLSFNSYRRESSYENKYLYNSKEFQDELDLGWYDYITRQYDPVIGKFLSVDPAADLMRRFSTYAYSFDNPIRFTDPDGMIPDEATGDPEKKKQQEKPKQEQEDPNIFEKGLVGLLLGMEKLGEISNQGQGNDTDDIDNNLREGALTIGDFIMTAFGAYMAPVEMGGGSQIENKVDDVASQSKNVASKVKDVAKESIEVTETTITKALEGSTMKTIQDAVSLPMVQRYVKMLENGSVPPPVKVANGILVDGNHRYVAGRVFGVDPQQVPYVLPASQADRVKPIQQIKVSPLDWGGY